MHKLSLKYIRYLLILLILYFIIILFINIFNFYTFIFLIIILSFLYIKNKKLIKKIAYKLLFKSSKNLSFNNKRQTYSAQLSLGYQKIRTDENGGLLNYATTNFDDPLLYQVNLLNARLERPVLREQN